MTPFRTLLRRGMVLTLVLSGLISESNLALAQKPPDPPQKEVTDGFFDVPARDPSEIPDEIGLPAYLVTAGLAGLTVFLLCKSARRS